MGEDGEVELLPAAPMTQSNEYNKTSQADKERNYDDFQSELVCSSYFQEFVRHWSAVHGLGPNEPILAAMIQTRIEPFAKIDADGSGGITREEYEAATQKKDFDKIDTSGDGIITLDEYLKATPRRTRCPAKVFIAMGWRQCRSSASLVRTAMALTPSCLRTIVANA